MRSSAAAFEFEVDPFDVSTIVCGPYTGSIARSIRVQVQYTQTNTYSIIRQNTTNQLNLL